MRRGETRRGKECERAARQGEAERSGVRRGDVGRGQEKNKKNSEVRSNVRRCEVLRWHRDW